MTLQALWILEATATVPRPQPPCGWLGALWVYPQINCFQPTENKTRPLFPYLNFCHL